MRRTSTALEPLDTALRRRGARMVMATVQQTAIDATLEIVANRPLPFHTWQAVIEEIRALTPVPLNATASDRRLRICVPLLSPRRVSWDKVQCGPYEVFLGEGRRVVCVSLIEHPLVVVVAPRDAAEELLRVAVLSLAYSTSPACVAINSNLGLSLPHSRWGRSVVSVLHHPPQGVAYNLARYAGKVVASFDTHPRWTVDALVIDYRDGFFRVWYELGVPTPFLPAIAAPSDTRRVFAKWAVNS